MLVCFLRMASAYILDTTLRDGTQGVGINFTLQDKLDITRRLDDFGIDYIEGGFPLASPREAEYFQKIKKTALKHAKIVAFGSTRRPHLSVEKDPHLRALLDAETPTVVIVGKGWIEHVTKVVNTDAGENLQMIFDSVRYLKEQGREVILDIEHFFDGWFHNENYSLEILQAGTQAGTDWLVLCDTNGGVMHWQAGAIVKKLQQQALAPIGIHTHNDSGAAVAVALEAIRQGARQVHGTINGWGERCGNANLCTLIPDLVLKMNYKVAAAAQLSTLTPLARYVAEKANITLGRRQPYVGSSAFTHKAGQHADVINKAATLMEHIQAEQVGNEREVAVSELSGRSTMVYKMKRFGDFSKKSLEVEQAIVTLKEREKEGYEYEAAESSFELLILRILNRYEPLFALKNYHMEVAQTQKFSAQAVGRVFIDYKGVEIMGAAVGSGPVDTLDLAVRNALRDLYPLIKTVGLSDYRVRVIDSRAGTAAKVKVLISCSNGECAWDTIGVSTNVIEATWQALVDAYDYYYNFLDRGVGNDSVGTRELVR